MTNILMSLEIIKSQLLTPNLPFQMAHGKSIRGLERVSEKALDFTATLCRRLAGAPLDVASFPVTVAETRPLTVMAPLLLPASVFSAM